MPTILWRQSNLNAWSSNMAEHARGARKQSRHSRSNDDDVIDNVDDIANGGHFSADETVVGVGKFEE